MDINSILVKYYFNVFDHNSSISNGHYLHFNVILFNVYDHNSSISNGHYLHLNVKLFSCLLSQFMYFKWTLFAF